MKHKSKLHLSFVVLLVALLAAIYALGIATPLAYAEEESADTPHSTVDFDNIYFVDPDEQRTIVTETIYYSTYQEDSAYINVNIPFFVNTNGNLTNCCAPVAGTIVAGYYDRYMSNLINSYTPGFYVGNDYYYYGLTSNYTYVQGTIDTLYSQMGTNSNNQSGTTKAQYKNGLMIFCLLKGCTITFVSTLMSDAFNLNNVISHTTLGHMFTLYLSGYNNTAIYFDSGMVTYSKEIYTMNHIMIAYGYKRIRYYDANNVNFRTDVFLRVADGNETHANWYLVGSSESTLLDVEATYIH